jgi:DNA-binding response OmpR family regulator
LSAELKPRLRVLIVDDDPDLQKLVSLLLQRSNMESISAAGPHAANQILQSQPLPDIMLLDLMMPEMNGVDFLKLVRTRSEYDSLPVIILSALADPLQIREGLNSGADRYLTKPYLTKNLVQTIHEVLKVGRVRR